MPPEDETFKARERTNESQSDAGIDEFTREAQAKSGRQLEQEKRQSTLRKKHRTNSTASLPKYALDLDEEKPAAITGDRQFKLSPAEESRLNIPIPAHVLEGAMSSASPAGDATADGVTPVDKTKIATDADLLYDGGNQWLYYTQEDYNKIYRSLEGKTSAELQAMDDAFKAKHDGQSMREFLNKELGKHPEELNKALALLDPPDKKTAARSERPQESSEEIKAKDARAIERLKSNPEVRAEHIQLEKRARETMKQPELSKFLKDMNKMEERVASLERQYQKELEAKGMDSDKAAGEAGQKAHEQVEKTYRNIGRLLERNDTAPVSGRDRILLAKQAMQHAADPTTISQGNHGTCSVATVETRTFTRDPAEGTRLLADVATTSKYKSNGTPPIEVEIDKTSLKKQGESNHIPNADGERDYASQLFQVTAMNIGMEMRNQSATPPGRLKYEQHPPVPGRNPPDNGERVVDYSQDPLVEILRPDRGHGTGLRTPETAGVAKHISPTMSDGPVAISNESKNLAKLQKLIVDSSFVVYKIDNGKALDLRDPLCFEKARKAIADCEDPKFTTAEREKLEKTLTELQQQIKLDEGVVYVQDGQGMKEALSQAKRAGKLPIVVAVDTNHEPFWSDSNGGDAGGSGGGHAVTVTEYDEQTGVAQVQNQWNKSDNHQISAKQLFEATRITILTTTIAEVQNEVEEARRNAKPDYVKEYELLRLQKAKGQISDADYDDKLTKLSVEGYKALKESGRKAEDDPEYQAATRQVSLMIKKLADSEVPADQARAKKIKEAVAKAKKDIDAARK